MHITARFFPFSMEFTRDQRRLAGAGIVIFLLIGAVQALYGPVLPSVRASFGISVTTASWTVGAHGAGAVCGVLLSLILETRLRSRGRVMMGLVFMGIGGPLFAVLDAWPWALVGVGCIGVGYGTLVVVVNALFAAGFGERSAALVILVNACFGLGSVIGPLGYGLFSSGSFRPTFLIIGAFVVLILPLGWSIPEIEILVDSTPAPVGGPPVGGHPPLALGAFVVLFMAYTATESTTSGWMATHLISHGYSQATAAEFTAAFWGALTLGRFLSVPVSQWLTPFRMIASAMTGVIVMALAARYTAIIPVTYVVIGILLAPVFPVGFAWMGRALRGQPGMASLALLGALTGGLVFPVLVGRVIGASTPDVLPLALATIASGGLLVSLWLPYLIRDTAAPREGARCLQDSS